MPVRIRRWWAVALFFGLLLGWAAVAPVAAEDAAASAGQEEGPTLVIMHTNDVHTHIEQFNKYGGYCDEEAANEGKCFGGVARRMTQIQAIRAEYPDALLLDAGDEFQGTLFFTQYKGQATAEFMNWLGYDAMSVGNHEFDAGPETLAAFIQQVEFPVLGANVDAANDPALAELIKPYVILQAGDVQVGVIGVVTPLTGILSSPGPNVTFTDPVAAVQKYAAELEEQGVNIIVVLSHLGYVPDQDLAAQVEGVDIIVGGHSHTLLSNTAEKAKGPYPTVVTSARGEPVLIVQDGSYGRYLGFLKVTFSPDGVAQAWEGDPILLDANVEQDPEVLARVEELAQPLNELRQKVIGEAAVDLDGSRESCRFAECTMGNLVTDAILWATQDQGVQIALQNGGGIRASIPAGPVTVGQVLEVLPFGNTVATFEIKGADLLAALENGVSRAENPENEGTGRFLQVAGLRYTWDPTRPVGERIVSVEVRAEDGSWQPLDPDAVYKVAANNFIRNGGDEYSMFAEKAMNVYDFGPLLADVVMDYIAQHSPVTAELEGRITRVEGAAEEAAATPEPTEEPTEEPTPKPTQAPTEEAAAPEAATEAPMAETPAPAAEAGGGVPAWAWVAGLLAVAGIAFWAWKRTARGG